MTEQKMLAPNVTLWWIDRSGVADYTAITVAEINAGTNVSCAVVEGYTLNPTDPNTDNTRSICDEGNVDNDTTDQYEGNVTFFRDKNIADNTSVFNKAFNLFKTADADGYWVRRVGKKADQLAAANDDVEVFGFTSDFPRSVDGAENAPPIQFSVRFIPNGEISGYQTLAA